MYKLDLNKTDLQDFSSFRSAGDIDLKFILVNALLEKRVSDRKGFTSTRLGATMTASLDRQLKDLYPELLTAQEVADFLETTRTTVNNMRKRGQLGGLISSNGNVFFLKDEVDALKLKRNLQPPKIGRPRKKVKRNRRPAISIQSTLPILKEAHG